MKKRDIVRIIFVLFVVTVIFAAYGYTSYYDYAFDDAIYKTLQLFTIGAESVPEKSFAVNIARFLAPIVIVCGGVQLAYYISQNGWKQLCLWTFKKHTIICGYGTTGKTLSNRINGKKFIVIDPLIDDPKISFTRIFLNSDATNKNVLLKEAKIDKASEIIITTGSDYVNMMIYDIAKGFDNIGSLTVRLEQLDIPDKKIIEKNDRIKFFNLSEIVVKKLKQYNNQIIVIAGIGNIGKRIINRYKETNIILAIEQSISTINMVKDVYNTPNIKYERVNVNEMIEDDFISILEKHHLQEYKKIVLFICLGGDWLCFRTAWKWMSWTKMALDINLVGTNINKNLLKDNANNSISIYNLIDINNVVLS